MPERQYDIADSIKLQFVWKTEDGSFLRALFNARITGLDTIQERYIVQLEALFAKKEEDETGSIKPLEDWTERYWEMIEGLQGRSVAVAYEAADTRPLLLRLKTLTLEHDYFTRFS